MVYRMSAEVIKVIKACNPQAHEEQETRPFWAGLFALGPKVYPTNEIGESVAATPSPTGQLTPVEWSGQ